ncbi:hypothetical protein OROMI_013360 [Orobanche minor]
MRDITERLFNKFLWGTNDNRRRLHWAAWSRLCYPKDEGGFGCRDLHDIIRAGEIKMWWRFRTIDNIWSNFLREKYCSRLHPMIIKLNPKSSPVWKKLCGIRVVANDNFFWHRCNGMVSFWHDRWFAFGKMVSGIGGKLVTNFLVGFVTIFAPFLLLLMASNLCGLCPLMGFLTLKPPGNFLVKKNLRIIFFAFVGILLSPKPYRSLWSECLIIGFQLRMASLVGGLLPLMRVIAVTVWKVYHISFLMGRLRKRCGRFFINSRGSNFLSRLILNLLSPIGLVKLKRVDNVPFTTKRVCERIWKYISTLTLKGISKILFWKGADSIAAFLGINRVSKPKYIIGAVRWYKPVVGCFKINTDGASKGNPGIAAAGGVIRNHLGHPIFMFSEFLGDRSNNFAEIYAIWRGLEFCHEQNFIKVWVEVDPKIALHLIEHSISCHCEIQGLIFKIRGFMEKMDIHFSHIFREGNAVADFLANQGCEQRDFYIHDITQLKGRILGLIKLDKISYPYIRSKK